MSPKESTECFSIVGHDFVPLEFPVYCTACGAVPGRKTSCSGGLQIDNCHTFELWKDESLYCKSCGAVPGKRSACSELDLEHSFVSARKP